MLIFRIIHLNGFTKEMLEGRKFFAYSNIKRAMNELLEAMHQKGLIPIDRKVIVSIPFPSYKMSLFCKEMQILDLKI